MSTDEQQSGFPPIRAGDDGEQKLRTPIPAPVPPSLTPDLAKMVEAAVTELHEYFEHVRSDVLAVPDSDKSVAILLRHLQPLAEQRKDDQEANALQLAACDCAAMLDTPETHAGNKVVVRGNPAWSPAFDSVMRRTAECIDLRAQLTAAQEELAALKAENKRLLDQTSAGYVFNQMKRAWVALGHPAHEYKPHKFIEVCTALQSAHAKGAEDGKRLDDGLTYIYNEVEGYEDGAPDCGPKARLANAILPTIRSLLAIVRARSAKPEASP